jgi:hypothetical protein
MDERVAELAEHQAQEPEPWAIKNFGEVPIDPIERWRWAERAGEVTAYRERYGVDDPETAIGQAPGRKPRNSAPAGNVASRANRCSLDTRCRH